jgi:hypothetical protein
MDKQKEIVVMDGCFHRRHSARLDADPWRHLGRCGDGHFAGDRALFDEHGFVPSAAPFMCCYFRH